MVALVVDLTPMDTLDMPPLEAVGLVLPALHPEVRRALAGLHVHLELSATAELVVARLESDCPQLLLVDTDLLGCPADLCTFARSLRPDVKVFGLAYYWSEHEDTLRACADALLHKPARDAEWRAVLRRFGVQDVNRASNQSRMSLQ